MGYWKAKVLPKIKQIFEKNGTKKAAAAEACKTFDESKEQYSKEFEEKKTELQPKVIEIYEAAAVEIKDLVKDPKDVGLKKHSSGVQKFVDELAKIEFPGSKAASEASSKFGASYVSGPIIFVLEKVSTFIVTEDRKEEEKPEIEAKAVEEETSGSAEPEVKEKEISIEAEKVEEPAAAVEPPKVEEAPAAAEPPKA